MNYSIFIKNIACDFIKKDKNITLSELKNKFYLLSPSFIMDEKFQEELPNIIKICRKEKK